MNEPDTPAPTDGVAGLLAQRDVEPLSSAPHVSTGSLPADEGVNATGLAFNSAEAVERMPGGRTNPMVRELGLDVFATRPT